MAFKKQSMLVSICSSIYATNSFFIEFSFYWFLEVIEPLVRNRTHK